MQNRLVGLQPQSAMAQARKLGLRVDETAEVEITTGVTVGTIRQKGLPSETVVFAHFCSSRWKLHRRLSVPPLISPPGELVMRGGIGRLPQCALVRARCNVTMGREGLLITEPRLVRAVAIPDSAIEEAPWIYDGGAEYAAAEAGFSTLDAWFKEKGQEVVLN